MSYLGGYSLQDEIFTPSDSQYSTQDSKSASTLASGVDFLILRTRTSSVDNSLKNSLLRSPQVDSKGSFRKDDDNQGVRSYWGTNPIAP